MNRLHARSDQPSLAVACCLAYLVRRMFSLSHDIGNCILLFSAADVLTTDDLRRIKRVANRSSNEQGRLRIIVDLAGVRASAVPASFLAECTRLPEQGLGEACIVVAPSLELSELAHQYSRRQREIGGKSPAVVASLEVAFEHLDVDAANFQQLH